MDTLHVRVYNVRFGDAILISVPDRTPQVGTVTRHILVDLGNALRSSSGGAEDSIFGPVLDSILQILQGQPLDLYVMTHEHMDHVQGLLYCSEKLGKVLPVKHVWLTASAALDYYARHPNAKKKLELARQAYLDIQNHFAAASQEPEMAATLSALDGLLFNNDWDSTAKCVQFLRGLSPNHTTYVYRGCGLTGTHPFREARLRIWAPEEDTSVYYGRLQPMAMDVAAGDNQKPVLTLPLPPGGVDAGAFYNLIERRRRGISDNLLAIDRAANNTSVVFSLEWRGWRLLFTGDAEQKSWQMMNRHGVLKPVHFLKVSHHGSDTGMPPLEILEKILPATPRDPRPRSAAVSTWENTYPGIPDPESLDLLKPRCTLQSTLADLAENALFLSFKFDG